MATAFSESSPLLVGGTSSQRVSPATTSSSLAPSAASTPALTSPSALVRPGTDNRSPKPPRSVTFDANPVSRTIDLSPTPSPPARQSLPSFGSSRRRHNPVANQGGQNSHGVAATSPTPNASQPPLQTLSYGSVYNVSPSGRPSTSGGLVAAATNSGGPPVLTALNNRLRRRNSSGSASFPGQQRQQLQQLQQHQPPIPKIGPQRSSKNAQKLKLLPNPDFGDEGPDEESGRDVYSQYTRIKDPTARRDAAFLGKADRGRLPRVTAYCTANRYQVEGLMRFLKGRGKTRGANPKLIDECVYTPYNYEFGKGGGNSNGNSNSQGDREADRQQRQQEYDQDLQRNLPHDWEPERDAQTPASFYRDRRHSTGESDMDYPSQGQDSLIDLEQGLTNGDGADAGHDSQSIARPEACTQRTDDRASDSDGFYPYQEHHGPEASQMPEPQHDDAEHVDLDIHVRTPEVFLFDYGVVVIWGMSEAQEQRFLKELARFETEKLAPDDVEAEFFNFYYTREYQARIYNDFIALRDDRSGSYMTKLAISHALAQSVKTSLFEELIASTVETCKDIPAQIAATGTIALSRAQINMQIGELFILRINIHLNGSVLDTPELFWVEPQLEPVYQAVRSYLEMDQRVSLLTQRLDVIADLLAVLKEQLSHGHGEKLEWIVIILIAAEIFVAMINIVVDIYAGG